MVIGTHEGKEIFNPSEDLSVPSSLVREEEEGSLQSCSIVSVQTSEQRDVCAV